MKKLSFLTVGLFTLLGLYAQTDSTKPEVNQEFSLSGPRPGYTEQVIPSGQIKAYTPEKKNSVLKGGLIGFGIGASAGIIFGLASGNSDSYFYTMSAKQKAILGGAALGVTGTVIGIVFGALAKKKFTIGESKKRPSRDLQGELMLRLVQK